MRIEKSFDLEVVGSTVLFEEESWLIEGVRRSLIAPEAGEANAGFVRRTLTIMLKVSSLDGTYGNMILLPSWAICDYARLSDRIVMRVLNKKHEEDRVTFLLGQRAFAA
jgi:hypothetical protein